jgi:outer membrane protein TolC
MKKLCLITLIMLLPLSSLFAGGRQEAGGGGEAKTDMPATPIELRRYAGEEDLTREKADEGPLVLTVEEAVEQARAYNLDIKSQAVDLRIKERKARYAWNDFIPTAQASATLSRMNEEQEVMTGFDLSGPIYAEAPRWGLSAGLDFSLTLNIALGKAINSIQKEYWAQQISYDQAKEKLARDVRKSFFNLLLMQEQRKLMVEQIETAGERFEQTQINYENGLVPELSVLNAKVAYENLKPALGSMDLGYRQALQGFKMNLGLELDREISLKGDIEGETMSFDADALIEGYLARRHDIRFLVANIEAMDDSYTANKLRAFTPTLSLGLNFDPTLQGDPWKDPWFDDISNDWQQRSGMFRMTVAMSLDGLLPFSNTQVGLREMEDSIDKMRLSLGQALRGAEMEIRNLVDQIEKSRDTIDTLLLNVETAQRAYEMAEEAYNVGSRELLEVKDAEDELQKAKLEVLKERYNYLAALLDLEYAIDTSVEEVKK